MTIVVTRNVSNRIRGFLASSMLELSPGVYSAPHMSVAVRQRIWEVLEEWFQIEDKASITIVWQDNTIPCGQNFTILGSPPVELVEIDGLLVSLK